MTRVILHREKRKRTRRGRHDDWHNEFSCVGEHLASLAIQRDMHRIKSIKNSLTPRTLLLSVVVVLLILLAINVYLSLGFRRMHAYRMKLTLESIVIPAYREQKGEWPTNIRQILEFIETTDPQNPELEIWRPLRPTLIPKFQTEETFRGELHFDFMGSDTLQLRVRRDVDLQEKQAPSYDDG